MTPLPFPNERNINKHENIALGGDYSVMVYDKLPAKLKDPSSFSIPCMISNVCINRALYDLGSSVTLTSYSILLWCDLGHLQSTPN